MGNVLGRVGRYLLLNISRKNDKINSLSHSFSQAYTVPPGFSCPWVPIVPSVCIFFNIFLFAQVCTLSTLLQLPCRVIEPTIQFLLCNESNDIRSTEVSASGFTDDCWFGLVHGLQIDSLFPMGISKLAPMSSP
ncbi:hypothetical protein RHMOL_Rhmol01G0195300 [Rhododendron molle]|uniref:Uncharacterized protein n=1 Tax=Rhododendron molle TaxID=49168 RepID=A0ACC0Q6C6_RHOML|nr:hypothetical protein RHMOL_Rhmol01G0195300 [Rhododendron molle]